MKALLLATFATIGVAPFALAADDANVAGIRGRVVERRAIEAVNWGIPVVNFDRMLQAFKEKGGGFNQIAYWGGLFDWKNQTLTRNPDTIYFKPFYDTKTAGPKG
ncbi:hypothetical protein [Rhizobium sullae]|uniref:hypothetical protein n=1 Tax=Rhizobium sullae TaxID=50338 RepID=UPI0015C5AC23|nr:hypothetical protein [Rhizobium sullae]